MKKEQPKKEPVPVPKPGQLVHAMINGEECGPFYFVGVTGDEALLQGRKAHCVPLKDIRLPS